MSDVHQRVLFESTGHNCAVAQGPSIIYTLLIAGSCAVAVESRFTIFFHIRELIFTPFLSSRVLFRVTLHAIRACTQFEKPHSTDL